MNPGASQRAPRIRPGSSLPLNRPEQLPNMPPKKLSQIPFIQSLDRGLTILRSVALSDHPVSLGEISDLLGIDRSSAFRLAHTLRRRGFLSCPAGKKDYILGSAIWTLSHQYDWNKMLVKVAHQELKQLAGHINETAHLAIREGKHALFVDCAHANHVIAVSAQTGELLPLYCTAHGKALLADADEGELKTQFGRGPFESFTKNTITSISALVKECAAIKKQGFAMDEAEYRNELRCVAAPIRLQNNLIVGSIGISAPSSRFPKDVTARYAREICEVAERIGVLLSHPD
jgi:DNA-binding IclR family transcriptional regulator